MPWWVYLIITWVAVGWIIMFIADRQEHENDDFKVGNLLFVVFLGGTLGCLVAIGMFFLILVDGIKKIANITLIKNKTEREKIKREREQQRHRIPDDIFRI